MTDEERQLYEALERRIAAIEERLANPEYRTPPPAARPPLPPSVRRPQWEIRFGLNWLSRIAVITVVLALAFFFQYAFENRWITESGRVFVGFAAGIAALAFGERQWRRQQGAFAQALTAIGLGCLYLSSWAAYDLYHMLPQAAAFLLLAAVTAATVYLSSRYSAAVIALVGLAGGFATPFWTGMEHSWWCLPFVFGYYAGFAATGTKFVFVAAQITASLALASVAGSGWTRLAFAWAPAAAGLWLSRRRNWPAGATATLIAFWLAYLAWRVEFPSRDATPALIICAGVYLTFLAWPLLRRQTLGAQDLFVTAVNPLLYFAACYQIQESAWYAVGAAILQMAAARLLWTSDQRAALFSAGIAWVLLVMAVPIQLAGYRITMAWSAQAAALAWIGARVRRPRAVEGAAVLFVLVFLRLLYVDRLIDSPARLFTFLSAAAALFATAWWARPGRTAAVTYVAAHFVLLWALCLEGTTWAARNGAPATAAISVVSGAYALVLVAAGTARGHSLSRVLGISLIALVVVKLYSYDVWLLPAFYRMAAFGILGILLLGVSYFYRARFR